MSTKVFPVPDFFKKLAAQQSLIDKGRPYFVDKGFQSNIFWVTPIEDATRNVMRFENGVCTWSKELIEKE